MLESLESLYISAHHRPLDCFLLDKSYPSVKKLPANVIIASTIDGLLWTLLSCPPTSHWALT
jgi:hypothetical protein